MNVSFELLLNWGSKVMNSDEQFFKRADKQMLNQLWQENVIPYQSENTL